MPLGRISRPTIVSEDVNMFIKFYEPPTEDDISLPGGRITPDEVTPDVVIRRELLRDLILPMPAGRGRPAINLPFWVIAEPGGLRTFPSEMIRVRQGQIVHAEVSNRRGTHTIHWHGIEPSPMNDGVGKTSFEIGGILGRYVYQWQPREAGTYFYHCHKNTPLHFENGLYGLLIIDPPTGPGTAFDGGPVYDVEAFWVVDDFDPRWHFLDHGEFMGEVNPLGGDPNIRDSLFTYTNDGFLNDFRAEYFAITGVPSVDDTTPITDPRVAITAQVGQSVLIRVLNASYSLIKLTMELDATIIAMDGRPLGKPPYGRYSSPIPLKAGTPFELTTARRIDLIIKPKVTGVFQAKFEHYHSFRGNFIAQQLTTITVI